MYCIEILLLLIFYLNLTVPKNYNLGLYALLGIMLKEISI